METVTSLLHLMLWLSGLTLMGNAVLKTFNIKELKGMSHTVLSYWLGYVLYGCFMFILGLSNLFTSLNAWFFLILGVLSLAIFRPQLKFKFYHFEKDHIPTFVFAGLALLSLPAAMLPPTDTAALTQHFSVAKQFVNTGGLFFIERAFSFPLMSEMLNTAAYLIGGEKLMLLHSWSVTIMAVLTAYALARKRLRPTASWVFAMLILTVPAIFTGVANGSPIFVLMGLVTAAAVAFGYYASSENKRWLTITALLTGATATVSLLGLFIVPAFIVASIFAMKNHSLTKLLGHLEMFAAIALVFGSQWYVWAYMNSGDPLFPLMFDMDWTPLTGWSGNQEIFFNHFYLDLRNGFERTFSVLVWDYPLAVTIGQAFGANVAIVGPLFLIALAPSIFLFLRRFPFMTWEQHVTPQDLYMLVFILFYAFWFYFSHTLEASALLTMLPLVVLPAWVWGVQVTALAGSKIRYAFMAFAGVIILFQSTFSILLNIPKTEVFFRGVTVENYLENTLPGYLISREINENASPDETVLYTENLPSLGYYTDTHVVYAPIALQETIPLSYAAPSDVFTSMLKEGITYWATSGNPMHEDNDTFENAHQTVRKLIKYGCLVPVRRINEESRAASFIFKVSPRCSGTV